MKILGVRIDKVSLNEARQKVREFLNSNSQHTIFTPNPEMLVEAHEDKKFKEILNSSSLNICDGKGIQFVAKEKIERIPGVDFMLEICKIATEQGRSVYLLGSGQTGGPNKAVKILQNKFPNLKIAGSSSGNNITMKQYNNETIPELDKSKNEKLITEIAKTEPSIIFVGFGHKKQEWWITENLAKMPSVKIAMGVGGAFDFIGGNVKRAPKWMRNIGLEWLYRLIREPRRIKRIWNATIVFLFLNLIEHTDHQDCQDLPGSDPG